MDRVDRDRVGQTECDRGQTVRVVRAVLGPDRVADDRVAQVARTELLMSEDAAAA